MLRQSSQKPYPERTTGNGAGCVVPKSMVTCRRSIKYQVNQVTIHSASRQRKQTNKKRQMNEMNGTPSLGHCEDIILIDPKPERMSRNFLESLEAQNTILAKPSCGPCGSKSIRITVFLHVSPYQKNLFSSCPMSELLPC